MISTEVGRKPDWLKIKIQTNDAVNELKSMMRERKLNSVCEEAKCPNIHECGQQPL
jgi:lipoic acid synthetase